MSYHSYAAPDHIFFFQDPDIANQKRYVEMVGGFDQREAAELIRGLKTYGPVKTGGTISETLYLRRAGSEMYIVDVK
jgi:hypothetical protein